jgi:uncharacterized YccA/Bax inhibitor family protein
VAQSRNRSSSIDNAFRHIESGYPGLEQSVRFSSKGVFNKVAGLSLIAVACAIASWVFVPVGVAFACIFVAFAIVLVSWFRMRWAKVLAPAYAVTEGVALGAISSAYESDWHGIVPLAIIFTAAIFLTCLALYRTGLVRVSPRMVSLAIMGAMGLLAVGVLSIFISVPGFNTFGPWGVVIGVLCLGVAVLNLFTDFDYVYRAESLGVAADGEWPAAFAILTALVLVYLSILRILASVSGGGRRS